MWLEAIVSIEDLSRLVARILPVRIDFGSGALTLQDPRDVKLVAGRGLAVRCKGQVQWPVLGLHVPVVLQELSIILCPEIEAERTLVFRIEIRHADLAGVPTFVDNRITDRINQELRHEDVRLTWEFADTLSHVFDLPEALSLAEALSLDATWGRLRITGDAVVLAVSFDAEVLRHVASRSAGRPLGAPARATSRV
jgi:hypothetical protein